MSLILFGDEGADMNNSWLCDLWRPQSRESKQRESQSLMIVYSLRMAESVNTKAARGKGQHIGTTW